MSTLTDLIDLSHEIGREERGLVLLSEGNTSARLDEESFLVKASGTCLSTLKPEDAVACSLPKVLAMLDATGLADKDVDAALMDARLDKTAKKPSVEAVFHAVLLSLPGINFVGHSHAVTVNQILCSPKAEEFAARRMFPDEIVCCGVASVYIPLTDPGLVLGRAIRAKLGEYIEKHRRAPRVILMQNHGVITLGPSPSAVLAAMLMVEKAAQIFAGAAKLGGPVFLSEKEVLRIAGRPDEIYRQKLLNL